MKTVFMAAVSAILLGSAGMASAASHSASASHGNRPAVEGTWMADASMTQSKACGGYGYAFGGSLCETQTGGPVGGIGE
jgi:opacity protein-like surface antigen